MKKRLSLLTPLPLTFPRGRKRAVAGGVRKRAVRPEASWERLSIILEAQARVHAMEGPEVERQAAPKGEARDMALREAGRVRRRAPVNLPREISQ